ncbi:MAG: PKD domain-containing protein, partial [Candidatus Thermoplasmatota archaeon]|nr:PKD domain-containing protein [Candidatus Thermoplasmatota archaeon]
MGIAMRAMIGLIFVLFVTTNLYPSDGSVGSEDRYEENPIFSLLRTRGDTITVDINGTGDYTSIQEAINNSKDGDTIFIKTGIYREFIKINRSIIFTSYDENKPTLDMGSDKSLEIISDHVILSNIIMTGHFLIQLINVDNIIIDNCSFLDSRVAIELKRSSNIIIKNSLFEKVRDGILDMGSQMDKAGYLNIMNNQFIGSKISVRTVTQSCFDVINIKNITMIDCSYAITIDAGAITVNIERSSLTNCASINYSAIRCYPSQHGSNLNVINCHFSNNNKAITTRMERNIFKGNTFSDNKYGVINSPWGDRTEIEDNTFVNNHYANIVFNYTTIRNNHFTNNNLALWLIGEYNSIYRNYFNNNNRHCSVSLSNNQFNRIYQMGGGNYWCDYQGVDRKSGENQDEWGSDGYGDEPYHLTETLNDRYPIIIDTIPPFADAGEDSTINEGTFHLFSSNRSKDDNLIITAIWKFTYGEETVLKETLGFEFLFRIPGYYPVNMTVFDFAGNSDSDRVNITVLDVLPPNALSQGDLFSDEGSTLIFDGGGSWDTGGIDKYEWLFDYYGTSHVLEGVYVSFFFDRPGRIPVTLRVTDNAGHVGEDLFNVTIRDLTAPVAIAGDDIEIENGEDALFDGSLCTDNGILRYYNWSFSYDNTQISLTGITTSHIFEIPGFYDITLRIEDEFGNHAEDTLIVTVIDTIPPVPKISGRTKLLETDRLELNGYDSTDNGKIIRYVWTFVDDEPVEIEGPTLSYQFKVMSDHEVFLTVYDEWNNSATTSVLIEIADQTAPKANAGQDQKVAVGSTVILNGSLSTDNGIISRYEWSFTYKGEKKTLEGEVVSFKFDEAGEYQIILSVFDLADNYGDDKVTITVVGTGKLNGIVLDADGKPVPGATFEVIASDGRTYSATSSSDGSFSLEIPHGPFSWKIMKDGYKPISGTGSIDALEEKD